MEQFKPIESVEYTLRTAQGKEVVVQSSYTPIQLPDRPVWALVVMRDATLQKKRERRLLRRAMADPLTGLPNRTAFLEACLKELRRALRHPRPLTIAIADLDGFKKYNDQYGHPAGDERLKSLASLLRMGRRAPDLVARYGGDEFVLLLPETDTAGALAVADRLRGAVAQLPFAPITLSIGVAVSPEDGTLIEMLLSKADERLYEAKHRGGNQVVGPGDGKS
ncbi:MAG: GGDEF domain-containing protein [Candidatus Omnitrophica bacterium]|nr:GGDEF domain-containing protein [Candidatus Omnitrophota bacterium]